MLGWTTAIGVSASHLAPYWSPLSDPYGVLGLGWYSWLVMLAEIAAAFALGVLGLRALLAERVRYATA